MIQQFFHGPSCVGLVFKLKGKKPRRGPTPQKEICIWFKDRGFKMESCRSTQVTTYFDVVAGVDEPNVKTDLVIMTQDRYI